jgi:multidrug efflux pump subunit AcrB
MARNPVAANLLMFVIVLIGVVSMTRIPQETLPEASLDAIQVRMAYPGASPEAVEEGIVRRIEEQIETVEGIRRITAVAAENVGVVTAELKLGTDVASTLDEIKSEIDRITSFPVDAEEPEVRELVNRRQVIQLAMHGPVPERTLKELADRVKDDLTAMDEISYVRTNGVRDYEIAIEVSREALRAYGLSLPQVALAVRRGSMDLPGGLLRTEGEEILVRTSGQNYTGRDFSEIVLLARPDGAAVRLGDVARVTDGFEDADLVTRFDGNPAVLVEVYRSGDERVLDIVEQVRGYVESLALPAGVSVDIWNDESKLLKSRFELLVKNGLIGLLLVILALGLFLNTRLAFWVSAGILVSFLGTFIVMSLAGVTVNLISLVAFILALGIVVDDAIVIGENIFAEQERGLPPLDAAVKGVRRMARPVVFAVLTTIAAFAPLLFVPGMIGKFMRNVPAVMVTVLAFSLVESLFILPAHLSRIHAVRGRHRTNAGVRAVESVQARVARALDWQIGVPLDRAVRFATRHYGLVIVTAVSVVLLSVGLVGAGLVHFNFFHDIEGENVVVRLEMPEGTTAERTSEIADRIDAIGQRAIRDLEAELPTDHPPLLRHRFTTVGITPSDANSPMAGMLAGLIQPTKAEINFEILEAERREIGSAAIETAWRDAVGTIPGVKSLQFKSSIMTLGKPIQVELSAPSPEVLDAAVDAMKDELVRFAGVVEVEDDRRLGKREIELDLKPGARPLGLTLDDLARQVRAAYYGDEALRVQRGTDEVRVMVRLPREERDALADLDALRIRTAAGAEVPLAEVATVSTGYGPSSINRRDRRRVTTVTADVDEEVTSASQVIEALKGEVVPRFESTYPGLRATFEGEQREQSEAFGAIARGFLIALFLIYALLAIPFRSYTQPFIIMSAIPFGIIGAIFGHLLMGISVGVLSMFGIVGLSGVVVNDSLVLIDYINQLRAEGRPVREAVVEATKVRFRPILLTSLTTFLGVLPLILERSLQAQFLIPIAASLGFGILFSTFIVLILVPALVMLDHRIRSLFGRAEEPAFEHVPAESAGTP